MKTAAIAFPVLLVAFFAAIAVAQFSGGDFQIAKSSFDNGGGTSANGEFSLTATIGQPDANYQSSSGSNFLLAGGFWAKSHDVIFRNSFEGG